tara:strand:- start:1020 stop:1595 length:576 start_codon:yes stop_codon:yes gene_type:complete
MNKKADLSMTVKIGIGLVLGIILLLFSLSVGKTFLGMFFIEPSELTENSMNNLENLINGLGNLEGDSFPFSMSKGYYLVAFDKSKVGKSGSEGLYEKPANACYDSACLIVCLAKDSSESCKNSEFVKSFENIERIEVKEPGNPEGGIVSYVEEGIISLYIARKNNVLILKEMEEGETTEGLNLMYLNETTG